MIHWRLLNNTEAYIPGMCELQRTTSESKRKWSLHNDPTIRHWNTITKINQLHKSNGINVTMLPLGVAFQTNVEVLLPLLLLLLLVVLRLRGPA